MQRRIGDYKIISELGQGAMATVYRARREGTRVGLPDEVAIKVLRAEYLDDLGFRARFEREGRTITALQHEALVPVYEFGQQGKQLYIVMAYMPDGSLAERLLFRDAREQDTVAWAKAVLARVASALDYAHSQGIIHRDLKPSNVLFDAENKAHLGDFGIAWQRELDGRRAAMVTGTPAYMSPEQAGLTGGAGDSRDEYAARSRLTPASDIYALGVLAYRLLVGQLPFQAESPVAVLVQHVQEAPPAPRSVNPALSEGVERALLKALAKQPAQRFGSAGEFVEALETGELETGEAGTGAERAPLGRLESGEWGVEEAVGESEGLETGEPETGDWRLGIGDWRLGIGDWRSRVAEVWEVVYGWLVARPRVAFVLVGMLAVFCALGAVGVLRGWSGDGIGPGDANLEGTLGDDARGVVVATETVEVFLPLAPLQPGLVTPTATPAPTPSSNVRMLYDSGKVTLLNISGASLSLREVALRRVSEGGEASAVLAVSVLDRVAGGAVGTLPPGDCLQLLGREAIRNRRAGKPAECGTLRGWLATRETNELFEGVAEGDAFEVLLGEQVLQRCPLAEERCRFYVAQGQ